MAQLLARMIYSLDLLELLSDCRHKNGVARHYVLSGLHFYIMQMSVTISHRTHHLEHKHTEDRSSDNQMIL